MSVRGGNPETKILSGNYMRRRFKRTITTIESHEVITLKSSLRRLCPDCRDNSLMVTAAEAALKSNVSQLVVYRWIEAGLIHFEETVDGGLFVCLSSLSHPLVELSPNTKGTQQ